jgi:hypothetical protein
VETCCHPEAVPEAAIEEVMTDDPDLPRANHALLVLRRARLSRNEAAAMMIADLIYEIDYTGQRSPEIEDAHQAAWLAVSELAKALAKEQFAPVALWKAAIRATISWRELLM